MRGAARTVLAVGLAAAGLAASELAPPHAPEAPERPERIVALSLSGAEMLAAIVPAERIVAVHPYVAESAPSSLRERLAGRPRVGRSAGDLLALAPDLVVTAPYVDRTLVEPLARAGVAVHSVARARDFEAIFREMRRLGRRVGEADRARAAIARARARVRALSGRLPRDPPPRVLFLLGEERVGGRGSTYDALARRAGAVNVAAAHEVEGVSHVAAETLATWSADVVVVPRRTGPRALRPDVVRNDPRFGALTRARVIAIEEAHLSAASGYLALGLHDLVEALAP